MAFKFSRKAFLTGGAAGVGLMALNVCGASAAAPAAAEQENCLNVLASKLTNVKVSQLSGLPGGQWQAQPVFPAWAGYVDDTLALNSMFTFQHYSGQGTLYVAPEAGVASFALFVNNKPINTAQMAGGGVYAVDISGCTLNGDNTIQVSAVQPAGKTVQVSIPYPVVIEGTPEQVGLDRDVLEALEQLIQSDVDNGFPSAQMAVVKNGRLVYQNAWGRVNAYLPDGTPNTASPAVTNDTLYDLASNSKMYTANYALQLLVTQGKIDLDSRIVDLLGQSFVDDTIDITFSGYENPGLEVNKQWKSELTLRDILRHQAGFPADPQYHNDAFDQHTQKPAAGVANPLFSGWDGTPATRQATLKAIFKTPLMYKPGTKTVYSDVDYMLLAFVIESVTGQPLDQYLEQNFWAPMGLDHITYNPLLNGFSPNDCAATELNGNTRDGAVHFTGVRTATIQGQVHDEKAFYAMGGISGHAGLFSNAADLAKLASVMLTGGYGQQKFFSRNVIDTFTAPKKENAANWGLGWWREADDGRCWYFGTQSSSGTIGHQGWTGTLTLIDPVENLVVVYLTNKINSPVTNKAANPNKFNGNWYTSSTLGFVAQILYQGLSNRAGNPNAALSALLADMAAGKFQLVAKAGATSPDHPIVRAGYALVETLFDHAKATHSAADRANAKAALALLDPNRDAAELDKLNRQLKTLW
ncbi:MAG: penicillin binding protein PBP4B [Faecalibacterium prausnitzii]|nr:penicillin binding protein PBP4B [Faecalibacterium prausnitzii]